MKQKQIESDDLLKRMESPKIRVIPMLRTKAAKRMHEVIDRKGLK